MSQHVALETEHMALDDPPCTPAQPSPPPALVTLSPQQLASLNLTPMQMVELMACIDTPLQRRPLAVAPNTQPLGSAGPMQRVEDLPRARSKVDLCNENAWAEPLLDLFDVLSPTQARAETGCLRCTVQEKGLQQPLKAAVKAALQFIPRNVQSTPRRRLKNLRDKLKKGSPIRECKQDCIGLLQNLQEVLDVTDPEDPDSDSEEEEDDDSQDASSSDCESEEPEVGFHGDQFMFDWPQEWDEEKRIRCQQVVAILPNDLLNKCHFNVVPFVGRLHDILVMQGSTIPPLISFSSFSGEAEPRWVRLPSRWLQWL